MVKRSSLNDLNRVGRETTIPGFVEDENGDLVEAEAVVYLRKLNAHDREETVRKAKAAKAAVMIGAEDRDSEEYQAVLCEVVELGDNHDLLAEYAVSNDLADRASLIEAEVAGDLEGEWAKNDYLQGLFDRWRGDQLAAGLEVAFQDEDHEDHAEAVKVFGELKRYEEAVSERMKVEADSLRRDYESASLDELRHKLVKYFLDTRANAVFLAELYRWRILFGTRKNDKRDVRHFTSIQQVDDLDEEIFNDLTSKYDDMLVEGLEGKGSRRQTSSSPLSPSPKQEETSVSSGPVAASA